MAILESNLINNEITHADLMGTVKIPVIVSKQGSRLTYQMNLMFRQVTNLFDNTEAKPANSKENVEEQMDLKSIRNRFLRQDKVKELLDYIYGNQDSYILPPISGVTSVPFGFLPYNHKEIIKLMGEGYNLIEHPELTSEVTEKFDGMLQGWIIFKESDFHVSILDGNHRVACIHQLTTKGSSYKNLRIAIQIFLEPDINRQRQAFVDMNNSTPIDKSILTLFGYRDSLSVASKEVISIDSKHAIREFIHGTKEYIGFDVINDAVTRNSQAVLSLNMLKNMLIKFALGESGNVKKFHNNFPLNGIELDKLLEDFALYMRAVFANVAPYNQIKSNGTTVIPKLREDFISMTGAGLYIIAMLGHCARTNGKSLEQLAREIAILDWHRVDSTLSNEPNKLFRTGILNENGNISNNRGSLKSTCDAIAMTMVTLK